MCIHCLSLKQQLKSVDRNYQSVTPIVVAQNIYTLVAQICNFKPSIQSLYNSLLHLSVIYYLETYSFVNVKRSPTLSVHKLAVDTDVLRRSFGWYQFYYQELIHLITPFYSAELICFCAAYFIHPQRYQDCCWTRN